MAMETTTPTQRRASAIGRFGNATLTLVLCLTCSYVAVAAVVSMQQPEIGGGTIRIPVVLYGDGEEALSGLQFDVRFDPASYEIVEVTQGAASSDAGKEVILAAPEAGSGRVLVTGFNDNALFDGHVATVVLRALHAGASTESLRMDNILASDPDGYSVNIGYEDLYAFPPVPEAAVESTETPAPEVATEAAGNAEPSSLESDQGDNATDASVEDSIETAAQDDIPSGGVGIATPLARAPGAVQSTPPAQPDVVAGARTRNRTILVEVPGPAAPPSAPRVGSAIARSGIRSSDLRTPTAQPSPSAARPLQDGTEPAGDDAAPMPLERSDHASRLAFSAPVQDAFAPPGGNESAGARGARGATIPGLSRSAVGTTVLLGFAMFGLLVALRALLFERIVRRRWRRVP